MSSPRGIYASRVTGDFLVFRIEFIQKLRDIYFELAVLSTRLHAAEDNLLLASFKADASHNSIHSIMAQGLEHGTKETL